MTLIKSGVVSPDDFVLLGDEAPVKSETKIIMSLSRWQEEKQQFDGLPIEVGVLLPNTVDVDKVWPLLQQVPLIVLDFPSFGDGRAYSQARLLRGYYLYPGDIRACGAAVTQDQIIEIIRCGFSSLCLRADQNPENALRLIAKTAAQTNYQPSCVDGKVVALARRQSLAAR